MAEKIYFIKGSTLMAIAHAIRQYGNSYDNMSLAGMPSYISNFKSQAVFDAYISAPSTATATDTAVPSWDFVGRTDSKIIYSIKESSLLNIINALRQAGGFTDLITPADIPLYIKNNFVTQWDINSFVNKTITRIYNTTCTTIGAQAFQGCTQLSYVEFTKATTVGSSAFQGCVVLDYLSMPLATTVNTNAFSDCKSVQHLTIGLSAISSNTVTGPMTYTNANLRSVYLPNCYSILNSTFQGCTNLTYVSAPEVQACYAYAFSGCTSLKEIELPMLGQDSNNWTIGTQAFRGCTALETVSFPMVRIAGPSCFSGCTSLKTVYTPSLSSHSDNPFTGVTTLQSVTVGYPTVPNLCKGQKNLIYFSDSKATAIGSSAFQGCDALKLENCTFGSSTECTLTSIYESAFYSCLGITSLNNNHFKQATPKLNVGPYVFGSCINLSEINCSNFISVGNQAFLNCTSLTKATLPNATYLGRSVFLGCTLLSSLSASNVTSLYTNSSWFPIAGCNNITFVNLNKLIIVPAGLFRTRTALQSVILNGATTIYSSAFSGCTNLSNVQINGVTALISDNIFIDCKKLNENGIQAANLQYINSTNQGAFRNTGFVSIHPSTFPNLLSIGYNAFQSCASLRSVHLSTKVTYLGRSAFGQCTALTYLSAPGVTGVYTDKNYVPTSGCANLEFANFNGLTTVPYALFTGLTKLQSVYVNGATTLAQSAFRGCTSLTSIFANSLTNIGTKSTFENCIALNENGFSAPNLTSIAGENVFTNTGFTVLNSTAFPNLTYIGHWCFQNCASLSTVNLSKVTYLGCSVFKGCPLTYISVPAVTNIYNTDGNNAIKGCTNITTANFNGLTAIPYYLLNDRSKLTSVQINAAVTIHQSAFKNCTTLTSISANKVTDLRQEAFYGCTLLSKVSFAALATTGSNSVFAATGFINITSAMFPALTSVNHWMFYNCKSLTSVNLPKVTYLGASAFGNGTALTYLSVPAVTTIYTTNNYVPTSGCTNLAFANFAALTAIPRYLFTNLQKLSSVVLTNASDIQGYAFQSCNALTSITLPKATLIRSSAFINNTGIKNVQIGSTVSNALALTISAKAFSGCTNLSTISILHTSLATLQNSNAFTGTGITSTTGKIIVPASLYSSYQTRAQWSYFKNIMSTVTF